MKLSFYRHESPEESAGEGFPGQGSALIVKVKGEMQVLADVFI